MRGFQESKKSNESSKRNSRNNNEKKNLALFEKALLMQKKGELNKAAEIYQNLIENNYLEEKVFLNYATICQYLKKTNNAIMLLKEAIKTNPSNYVPFFKMGFILNNNGRFYEAYPFAKKAIDLNPRFWQGYHNAIKILRNLNRPKDAGRIAKTAKELFSNNHLFDGLLGDINSDIGNFKEAKKYYKNAISLAPDDDETLYSFANFSIGIGETRDSINFLKKVLNINPFHSISYYSLSTIINVEKNEEIKNRILNLKLNDFKTKNDHYTVLFSKSHIFHKIKEFSKSADFLKKANDLKLLDKPSNINEVINLSETIKSKTCLEKSFDVSKFKHMRDIFIVGLPRSGSTLVESIIGMNKDVHNLGENRILLNALVESEKSNFSNMDEVYFKYSQNFSSKKFTTNKMLSNYMHIPHIISKLEHSKVIYTFRNPLDNLLSMYRAKFTGSGNEYSSSLTDSANYYIHQFKIMSFYKEKYKNFIYFLNYDQLVNNPDHEIRKLIDWLGFSWDDTYLHPNKSQQGFFTASNVQVRSPINNKSVGGWQKYSKMMEESLNIFRVNNFSLESFKSLC